MLCVIARFCTTHFTPAEKCKLPSLFDKLKAPLLKCFHLYKGSNTVQNLKKKNAGALNDTHFLNSLSPVTLTGADPVPRDLICEVKKHFWFVHFVHLLKSLSNEMISMWYQMIIWSHFIFKGCKSFMKYQNVRRTSEQLLCFFSFSLLVSGLHKDRKLF